MAATKKQLAYFLLILCVIESIECGGGGLRHKRDDESEEKEPEKKEEEVSPTEVATEGPSENSSGKYPFIPDNVQNWFKDFGNNIPGGGPNKWFEQANGNKWMEDAGSFFSKAPWAKKEK